MPEPNNPSQFEDNERQVADPIIHIPLTVHDATLVELEQIPLAVSSSANNKTQEDSELYTNQRHPDMNDVVNNFIHENHREDPVGDREKLRIRMSIIAALGAFTAIMAQSLLTVIFGGNLGWLGLLLTPFGCCLVGICLGASGLFRHERESHSKLHDNQERKVHAVNKDDSALESASWLNFLLDTLWPIVDPSLFTLVADVLEDIMQATLPKLVRAVRISDIGQGSQPIRILGIRQLEPASAARDFDGMKAEEGNFVNLEVAVAYRAKSTTTKGMKERSVNAHLLIEIWVAGGMMIPVWVELTGLLSTARIRFQLTSNPPFFSLVTITLLNLPKVSLKCTPLAKNFLNVMDVPGLSGWIRRTIDMIVIDYVAPRSLTLDLRSILMGRPKMDTDAVGVIIVTIQRALGFKNGDVGKIWKSEQGKKGNLYVSIGWSKRVKSLWSTRIIKSEEPTWKETTALLVGPAELNGQERLRLQLWDFDRFTADDLLGNIEVSLQELMTSTKSLNQISIREDPLTKRDGESCSGSIFWECGYFAKTTLRQHLDRTSEDVDMLKAKLEKEAEAKLREAKAKNDQCETDEIEQQKRLNLKDRTDEIISGSKPTSQWPSGILSVRVGQISELEIEKSGVREDGKDEADDLPSVYCTIIVNHQKICRTRTKMKSSNPFYDAGTEIFIRDYMNADVIISVRDSKIREADPVIGIVVLPLCDLFKNSSQFTDSLPLVGGIGYGFIRLSLTFRSVQLQLPKRLLGWDVGTLEIQSIVKASIDLPTDYATYPLIFRILDSKGKMVPNQDGGWKEEQGKPMRLAIQKRYSSCLFIQLRKRVVGPHLTPAFCTLWLKDIPDNEEIRLLLPVRRNEGKAMLTHACTNATPDIGESVGTIELSIRIWPGLSGYHRRLAEHNVDMADVMEVLDYAEGLQDSSKDSLSSFNDFQDSSGDDDESSLEIHDLAKINGVIHEFNAGKCNKDKMHRGLKQWTAIRNIGRAWGGE